MVNSSVSNFYEPHYKPGVNSSVSTYLPHYKPGVNPHYKPVGEIQVYLISMNHTTNQG